MFGLLGKSHFPYLQYKNELFKQRNKEFVMSIYLEKGFDIFLKTAEMFLPELRNLRYYSALDKAIEIYRDSCDRRFSSKNIHDVELMELTLPFYEKPSDSIIFKPSIDLIKASISTNVSPENIRVFLQNSNIDIYISIRIIFRSISTQIMN